MRLQICHLSDIHFVVGENAILDKKGQLSRAILEHAHKNEAILFLISGDIAQSCNSDEYIKAMDFFIYLQDELKKEKSINSYFIFAPGNHDAILNPDDLDEVNRKITLKLTIDNQICPVLDYFEIFMERTMMSKYAAKYLQIWFELIINDTKLL